MQLFAIALIFCGEALTIAAELVASRLAAAGGNYFSASSLWMFLVFALGGAMLVAGYMLGYAYLKNIWIIIALSVGSILIIEPLAAYLLFREVPTAGAWIGLSLGALGTLAALFL